MMKINYLDTKEKKKQLNKNITVIVSMYLG